MQVWNIQFLICFLVIVLLIFLDIVWERRCIENAMWVTGVRFGQKIQVF